MNDALDKELREIEAQLANLSPIQMPDDMISRMEQALISWEDHLPLSSIEEKIVPFDQTPPALPPAKKKINLNIWGAAAAVALMTGLAAVFMTGNSPEAPIVANTTNSPSAAATSTAPVPIEDRALASTLPELSRNITHASNEGITFAGKDEVPFKVLRIEYTEQIVTTDKDGKTIITKKPCVEHILVPVPVH